MRGVLNDFVYDDIPLIRDNLRVHGLGHLRDALARAYWPPPFVEQLYRPLTLVALSAEYALGDGSPIVFRIVSYALYAVLAVAVYRLAARVLDPWIALGVAALFAIHPVHVEAVALGVNQAELLVGIIGVAMTSVYVDRRRAGALRGRDWALLALLYAIGTLVKESAFVIPLLLVAAEATVLREPTTRRFSRRDIGGYVVLAGVAAASVALRSVVVGAPAFAVIPAADLRGRGLGERMVLMLHVVPKWLRLFAWPQHLQVDFRPGEIASGGAIDVWVGIAILFAFVAAIICVWRRAPVLAFGLVWVGIALLPVANVVPSGVVLAERTLLLPSVGFLLAVGAASQAALANQRLPRRTTRLVLGWGCALLVVLGLLRSAGRQAVWNTQHLEIVPGPSSGETSSGANTR